MRLAGEAFRKADEVRRGEGIPPTMAAEASETGFEALGERERHKKEEWQVSERGGWVN